MQFFISLLIVLYILSECQSESLVCNKNECYEEERTMGDVPAAGLSALVKHTVHYLNGLNQNYDNKLDAISHDIDKIKKSLLADKNNQGRHDLEKSESLKIDTIKTTDYAQPSHLYDNLWITIQRRQDGSVNFFRSWDDYKQGFGNPFREFFIGLDKINELTSSRPHELLLQLEDFNGTIKYAKYDAFLVGTEMEKYQLKHLGAYSGDAGDYLRDHEQMFFSTKDRDNDANDKLHCAKRFQGGWWYHNCLTSHLNGPFRTRYVISNVGITWGKYDDMQIKTVQMMIRSKKPFNSF